MKYYDLELLVEYYWNFGEFGGTEFQKPAITRYAEYMYISRNKLGIHLYEFTHNIVANISSHQNLRIWEF